MGFNSGFKGLNSTLIYYRRHKVEEDGDMSWRDVYTYRGENKCRQDFGGEN